MNHYERIDRKPQATIGQVVAVGSGIDTIDKRNTIPAMNNVISK